MKFVIVTGMSGAGKTTALKFMEDSSFYCVDNLPPSLIPKFAEICFRAGDNIDKVALGIDIRGGRMFDELLPALEELRRLDYEYSILFLEASDEVLLKRYKETRRAHPLAKNEGVEVGISRERETLAAIKKLSTFILDTTHLLARQLKEHINSIFIEDKDFNNLVVNVVSFGFKYGTPNDADLMFDVRFIPNPFYIPEMRERTGNDSPVSNYVMSWEVTKTFLEMLKNMLDFLIPNYVKEGKNQLVIAIGCTGGKHRSVTVANEIFNHLSEKNQSVLLNHKNIRNS